MKEKEEKIIDVDTLSVSSLYGTRDAGELVKRSVYKVKRADSQTYDRVHFETDSKMVHDATNAATPNMVARRDSAGSIEFHDIKAKRDINIERNAAIKGTLNVLQTSTLGGKVTANNGVDISNGLNVKSGSTNLTGALTVGGISTLNNDVNINNNKSLKLNQGSDIVLSEGSEIQYEGKPIVSFEKGLSGHSITIGGGARTIIGSGEAANATLTNSGLTSESEQMVLASDEGITLATNIQNGWGSRKTVEITKAGGVTSDGTIETKQNFVAKTTGYIGGNLGVGGTATVAGATALRSTLGVTGKTTLTGGADILTSLNVVNASATIDLDALIKRNITVNGTSLLKGVVTADSNVNLTNGSLLIKKAEIRTGGTDNKSLVVSADDESLCLRASKADANAGEITINKTNIACSKPLSATGNIDSSQDILGVNVVAKNGQLRTTKNGLLTTLGSETTGSFDINTAAGNIRMNKQITVTGSVVSSIDIVATRDVRLAGTVITRGLVGSNTKIKFETDANATGFYFNKPIELPSGSAVSPNFNADKVDGCDVNDSSTATDALWTANKIDTTKANKAVAISAGDGLSGGGNLSANRTISHGAPGATVKTMGLTKLTEVIKSVNVDKYGHISSMETYDMDKTFATPEFVAESIANSNSTVDGSFIAHSRKNPQTDTFEKTKNTVDFIPMKSYEINYSTQNECIQFIFG